jgi:AcrR family transcriptional regulator
MKTEEKIQPRKNAQQFRSKETVKAIIQAATYILQDEGVKGFNTNKIAKKAGVSIGSLYQYFPNKDSISSMLFENFFETQIEIVTKNIMQVKKWSQLEEKIYDLVKELSDYRLSDQMINRPLALEISNSLFNKLMIEKKLELSRTILEILRTNLGLEDSEQNFILINLLVDSVDSMVFNLHEIELINDFDSKIKFISEMISCGANNLNKQVVA